MARPRNNEQGPTATQRIEQAFWDTLEHKPFNQITIKDITQAAKVNHNTFYYHYDNIEDLAQRALPGTDMELAAKNILHMLMSPGQRHFSQVAHQYNKSIEELRGIYHKLRLILKSASPQLVAIAKSHVLCLWPQILGLSQEQLTSEDAACLEFAWGGLTAVVASNDATTFDEYERLFDTTIVPIMTTIVEQILSRHPAIQTPHTHDKEVTAASNSPKNTVAVSH